MQRNAWRRRAKTLGDAAPQEVAGDPSPSEAAEERETLENLRRALAQEAARVMAEHGVSDFLFAKRKAAERFGVTDHAVLRTRVRVP